MTDESLTAFIVQVIRHEMEVGSEPVTLFYAVLTTSPGRAREHVEDIAEPGDAITATRGVLSAETVAALKFVPGEPFKL